MKAVRSAIEIASGAVAPAWPLDRQIAVNPYWGFINRGFEHAAATLGRLDGCRFTLPPGDYLGAWHAGEITAEALKRAISQGGASATTAQAVAALHAPGRPKAGLPLLSDLIDREAASAAGPRWRDTITQQVSQYCASYFDEHQADWRRHHATGLFAGWRDSLGSDHALAPLMRAPEIRARARSLPPSAEAAIAWALERLDVATEQAADFLQVCLLRIKGWASWCAYLQWEAGLAGTAVPHLGDLMAIRASWEALLVDPGHDAASPRARWRLCWEAAYREAPPPGAAWDQIWQRALEISHQDRLIAALDRGPVTRHAARDEATPAVQLVFCIDVRSERMRRALEDIDPALETHGCAGFFGLPLRYTPIGTSASRPQVPGLIAPSVDVTESTGEPPEDAVIAKRRADRLAARAQQLPFQRFPSGAFSYVEALGVGYAGAILHRHFGGNSPPSASAGLSARELSRLRPQLCRADHENTGRNAEFVASILRAMSLTDDFARLVVFVGHGSQSVNNPQAAALECGACGGQSGEINARVLAGLFNDRNVRIELGKRGIRIPADSIALGALHNTCTDEVQVYDVAGLPASHLPDFESVRRSLVEAGRRVRAERAPSLGMAALSRRPDALLKRLRRRARDWAEIRPEWGLANNAAFIVAPRSRTRGIDLAGRCFLHDYTWGNDPDGDILELIMTAPMIVTNWINLQYYASTVDPDRYGSGNKVLHNVVCGRIGVFEGNTGDLRTGLPRQSVRDGERLMHTPLRLSVFIDAPRDRIDRIIAAHSTVRNLIDNRWLHLFRFADSRFEHRRDGAWLAAHSPED
ncbi:MAG: DUF2309 domain-containing protein [Gammaproteobacteria bacterium]|nr:DUF2309 domain-containing protein [Gammaproteobacteria bacterium]